MRGLGVCLAALMAFSPFVPCAAGAQQPSDEGTARVERLNADLKRTLATLPAPEQAPFAPSRMAAQAAPASSSPSGCPASSGGAAARWLKYAAQGLSAFVVATAVKHGARERVGYGSSSSPLPFLLEFGAQDFVVDQALRKSCPNLQNTVNFLLALPAFANAANARTTP
jgi:hypothetical protein